jgi:transcription-repair coupling factor (superfamily II helicase)
MKLSSEYLVVQYADGILRAAADQLGRMTRFFRATHKPSGQNPNKMSGKAWKTKSQSEKVLRSWQLICLKLYAQSATPTPRFCLSSRLPLAGRITRRFFPLLPQSDQLKAVQGCETGYDEPIAQWIV